MTECGAFRWVSPPAASLNTGWNGSIRRARPRLFLPQPPATQPAAAVDGPAREGGYAFSGAAWHANSFHAPLSRFQTCSTRMWEVETFPSGRLFTASNTCRTLGAVAVFLILLCAGENGKIHSATAQPVDYCVINRLSVG